MPRIKYESITLIRRPKNSVEAMEKYRRTTNKENLYLILRGQSDSHCFFRLTWVNIDWIPSKGYYNHLDILCNILLRLLRDAIKIQWCSILTKVKCFLLESISFMTRMFSTQKHTVLARKKSSLIPHFSPCYFHPFPTMNSFLKRNHFHGNAMLISKVKSCLLD